MLSSIETFLMVAKCEGQYVISLSLVIPNSTATGFI